MPLGNAREMAGIPFTMHFRFTRKNCGRGKKFAKTVKKMVIVGKLRENCSKIAATKTPADDTITTTKHIVSVYKLVATTGRLGWRIWGGGLLPAGPS